MTFALIVLGIVLGGLFIVKQQTVAIVARFGKFARVAYPGLRFKIPLIETVESYLSLRIQQLNVQVETKTKDNVFIKIIVSVQFEVIQGRIYEAYYKLTNPSAQIEAFVFDVVRAKIPNIDLDDVFSKKDEIASNVKQELYETMAALGYNLIKALVTDIQPNENVKNAMNEINTAQRLRIAAQEKAEAEKIMIVKQAEAETEANILQGKGISGQRKAIIEGLGQSVEEIQKNYPHLSGDNIMKMILTIQYFDMLKEVGAHSKSNTVFVGHSPDNVNDITRQITEILFAAKNIKD
ncbi:MAG: SPFH domain-containing protein [Alphaproteobacteria bacterium]|nr:SPFH domain-containing protein [Alphaproteobacteria bacterium]OJV16077.1 MAG: SPFH domain-containing protein [Alphaproteobacteria bacterium 33-17]